MIAGETDGRSSADRITGGTRWLLVAFTVLTALAVVQLLVLSDVAEQLWAWTIHTELTAAFLGAAYGAGLVLSVGSLVQRDWGRIRVPILTVTVFTWLTAIPTVIHLHKLHLVTGGLFSRGVSWVWLAVYLVVPVACVAVVARQEQRYRTRPRDVLRPMPGWLTAVLAVEGVVLILAGLLLYFGGMRVHHGTPTTSWIWPWSLMPLSSQVIGAWLISLGLAAGLAIGELDLSRLRVAGMTYTAFGVFQFVAVLWYWPQVERHDLRLWGYLAVLGAVVATGAYGWWAARGGGRAADDAAGGPATGTRPVVVTSGPA